MVWPAIIGAVGRIAGGAISSSGQSSANRSNERIARENRAFQERMSSTAYQRSADDLEEAGLNRILALGQPASSPSGAMAVMQNAKAGLGRGVAEAATTAAQITKTEAEIKQIESNTRLTDTRGLIAEHGEAVASLGADLARTLRAMSNDMTPGQLSEHIKSLIDHASSQLTDILEQAGITARQMPTALDKVKHSISIYLNDSLAQGADYDPNRHGETEYTEAEYAKKSAEYYRLKGEAKAKVKRWLDRYRKLKW